MGTLQLLEAKNIGPVQKNIENFTLYLNRETNMRRFAAVILLVLLIFPANAYSIDGKKLVLHMKEYQKMLQGNSEASQPEAALFLGYVHGSLDSLALYGIICIEKVSVGKASAVVIDYLNKNPTRWGEFGKSVEFVKCVIMVSYGILRNKGNPKVHTLNQ